MAETHKVGLTREELKEVMLILELHIKHFWELAKGLEPGKRERSERRLIILEQALNKLEKLAGLHRIPGMENEINGFKGAT